MEDMMSKVKSNLHDKFATSINREKEGNWFEVKEGVKFLLRRMGSANTAKMRAAHAQYYKPHARRLEVDDDFPAEKQQEIMTNIFIDVCLVDWAGVELDGKVVPCNKENARILFKDLPDLVDTLSKYATDASNFKEDLGKS